jgi:Chaperone of endosialidase
MKTSIPLGPSTFAFVCFALVLNTQAVNPPPDGGYPGGNTAEGTNALSSRTTGIYNTAIGIYSLLSLTDGSFCTALGAGTLLSNTAAENTATGAAALFSNSTGDNNTASGAFALFSNTEGDGNVASGVDALASNTMGSNNTANGFGALVSNTIGSFNTGEGLTALGSNTTGEFNTATGSDGLFSNDSGSYNTANGSEALLINTIGDANTAIGALTLPNSTGSNNTALGFGAGSGVGDANNVICIGANVSGVNLSNSCFIGNVYGVDQGGVILPVYINSSGRLGTQPPSSSRRFKKAIKPMDNASEAILALKPVTFHYKKEIDPASTSQFGLVAEDVEKVNADLVVRDKDGKPYTVRYDAVNAMLLNEFLKEHKTMQEQGATIARQQKQIERLTAGLEKMSAQLEASKPAKQIVLKGR